MSRIRSKDTTPEVKIRKMAHSRGLRYRKHVTSLPGKPDLVFSRARVAVFVDGDFWHGWDFDQWKDKLAPYWRGKIEGNMARDAKNFDKLVADGWRVIRIWEHEVKLNIDICIGRIEEAVRPRGTSSIAMIHKERAPHVCKSDSD